MTVMVGEEQHKGRMTTISPNGALVLENEAGNEAVYSSGTIIKIEE